ncbi:aconitate hydratase, partial [bacterium]|nr:aconitate hydratase [bacterium]
SRDWAAKGTTLLGIKAVIAESFERIHRGNLIGMGVLPLQFISGENSHSLGLTGREIYTINLSDDLKPQQNVEISILLEDGNIRVINVECRLDSQIEVDYYRHKGILPYVLRQTI